MSIHPDTAVQAEAFRRKHCDSKERRHRCLGVITIKPGLVTFDCQLCGIESCLTVEAIKFLDNEQARSDGLL